MGEIEAIYEDGVLRIVKPAKIESDVVTVRILNKDEMLTEEDMKDILKFWKLWMKERRGIITS